MAKKKKRNGRQVTDTPRRAAWHSSLAPSTKKSILALIFFLFTILAILADFGRAGVVGDYVAWFLTFLLGKGYFVAPLVLLLGGISFLMSLHERFHTATIVGLGFFLIASLGLIELMFGKDTGGFLGLWASWPLLKIFDFWASAVILGVLDVAALLIVFDIPLWAPRGEADAEADEALTEEKMEIGIAGTLQKIASQAANAVKPKAEEASVAPAPVRERPMADAEHSLLAARRAPKFPYRRPPLELLSDDKGTPSSGDIKANANIIQRTLQNFGIQVEMAAVSIGPTITQYTLKPAEGVKLSRILALQNDLALALAAHPIRIEAPIPGKSLVGIEVPNRSIALVGLRSLLADREFQDAPSTLTFALGRDVSGSAVYADLLRMPHLLVAGATGAGKSVGMHVTITSFLYRNPPEMLRFIMVDPKRVELSIYNGIPHLLTPAITDPKKTIHALRWAVKEMERRYEVLAAEGARDIASFNAKAAARSESDGPLPYLIVIIDELADLMTAFPREVEGSIVRLAQMSRAVGIHLILSTQRPSVEIITGLIKANITARIAFQTGSQIDSRTILDMSGAEKLLGSGDMLFLAGDTAKPRRIQGAFVSETEVKKVVDFLKHGSESPVYEASVTEPREAAGRDSWGGGEDDDSDELYEEAKQVIIESGKASASLLQRRLRVGYARAARLLDILEENGVIGPGFGAKPREILIGGQARYAGEEEEADTSANEQNI